MVKKTKEEENIYYELIDNNTFLEKKTMVEEYVYTKKELDNIINELQNLKDSLKEPNTNELIEWARNNHPYYINSEEIKNKLKYYKDLRKQLFGNGNDV